jgi:hypothetical protein
VTEGGHLTDLRTSAYLSDAQVRQNHRRAVLRQIVLPVGLAVAVMILVLVIMILAFSPSAFNTIASFMSLLILVPTVILCVVPYVLIVAAFGGTRKLYVMLPRYLQTARHGLHRVNVVAQRASVVIAKPVIAVSGRLAWVEQVMNNKPPKKLPPSTSGERKFNER